MIFETTLPVGDTRGRFAPALEAASGLTVEDDLFVAFSPERLLSGHVFQNLATYPKLVGGLGPASTARAAAFYASVLDAEVVAMSNAEAAEFAKLAETTYRDVNIALANEFANYAERSGVDILEVITAANSQPYSHIHQPGIGVGGHCIPVYPHFLLSRAPEMTLVDASRKANDGQVDRAIAHARARPGEPRRRRRARARPDLPPRRQGARLLAGDPADRRPASARRPRPGVRSVARRRRDRPASARSHGPGGVPPPRSGRSSPRPAIPQFASLDPAWFPALAVVLDGRNSLPDLALPAGVAYHGIGIGATRAA